MYLGPGFVYGKVRNRYITFTKMFYYLLIPEIHGPIKSNIFWNVVIEYDMYIHFHVFI